MIGPLLTQLPRLLLFVIPVFVNIKIKDKSDDSSEKCKPGPESEGADT